jgi:transcriptional regulator with XRE-family HTH domain
MSQAGMANSLGVSAMAISRWESGRQRPSGTILLKLGILAQKDAATCWSFWNLAGLATSDVVRVLPFAEK